MDINEWKNLHSILDGQYSEFQTSYETMKNGKNKKIRSNAERKVDNNISLCCYWIKNYPEAFELLTGGENSSDFHRAVIWDEFVLPRYFNNDMDEFLERIEEKIEILSKS